MATPIERPTTRSRGASALRAFAQDPPTGDGGAPEEHGGKYGTTLPDRDERSRRGSGAPGSLPGASAIAAESTRLQEIPAKEGPGGAENRP